MANSSSGRPDWLMTIVAALAIGAITISLFDLAARGLAGPTDAMKYTDLVAILLGAVAVILAAVTLFVGVAAVWGYGTLKFAAETKAAEVADSKVRELIESQVIPVAVRAAQDAVAGTQQSECVTGALSGEEQ
jgi:uncharacterized membrane protein YuzA (DUF378 family)